MLNKFYITTSIAYVNASPHLGFALELIQADVLARYHKLKGEEVFFLTGTDEHGAKIARAAEATGKDKQQFVDEISVQFASLTKALNVSNNDFIRTTDQKRHWPAVIKIWQKLQAAGDLYRKNYKGLYCVGHEAFMKPSELKNGECVLHKQKPEVIEEENWFFKLTRYKKEIKKAIADQEMKILPAFRQNEVLNLLEEAEDVSFSRPRKDLDWGIPVPGDEASTMYVWPDALTNYLSAIGYENGSEQFRKLWPADVHLIGKDILRFHALIWPAMLLAIGLPLPKALYVHGFITVEGEKMSKTVGNIINPFALIKKYGVEPVRYFLLREIPSGEDGDFSYAKLEERYNGDLANGLGNLVRRVLTLIENGLGGELNYQQKLEDQTIAELIKETGTDYQRGWEEFRLHDSLAAIWELIGLANGYVNEHRPWESVKDNPDHFLEVVTNLTGLILTIVYRLQPFLPETAEKIFQSFGWPTGQDLTKRDHQKLIIAKGALLFPKLS